MSNITIEGKPIETTSKLIDAFVKIAKEYDNGIDFKQTRLTTSSTKIINGTVKYLCVRKQEFSASSGKRLIQIVSEFGILTPITETEGKKERILTLEDLNVSAQSIIFGYTEKSTIARIVNEKKRGREENYVILGEEYGGQLKGVIPPEVERSIDMMFDELKNPSFDIKDPDNYIRRILSLYHEKTN